MATEVLTKAGLATVWSRIKGIYDPKIAKLEQRVGEIETDINDATDKLNEIIG